MFFKFFDNIFNRWFKLFIIKDLGVLCVCIIYVQTLNMLKIAPFFPQCRKPG